MLEKPARDWLLIDWIIDLFRGTVPVICAKDAAGLKYKMAEEFSVDSFRQFMVDLQAGDIEPYLKSG